MTKTLMQKEIKRGTDTKIIVVLKTVRIETP